MTATAATGGITGLTMPAPTDGGSLWLSGGTLAVPSAAALGIGLIGGGIAVRGGDSTLRGTNAALLSTPVNESSDLAYQRSARVAAHATPRTACPSSVEGRMGTPLPVRPFFLVRSPGRRSSSRVDRYGAYRFSGLCA